MYNINIDIHKSGEIGMENFVSELRHVRMHRRCEQYTRYKKFQRYKRYNTNE